MVQTTINITAVMPSTRIPASTLKAPISSQVMLAVMRWPGSASIQKWKKIRRASSSQMPRRVTPIKSPRRGSLLPRKKVIT